MPIIKSAIKRMHQTAKRRARNVKVRKSLKNALKVHSLKVTGDNLKSAQSQIDRAVKKNLLNKNTAARMKSSLSAKSKAAGVKVVPAKKAVAAKPAVKKVAAKPVAKKPAPKTAAKK